VSRKLPIDVLKERIDFAYDPDSIVDMLDISVVELLEAFEDKLVERREVFSHLEEEVFDDDE
jgi:hypothetical protein